MLFLAAVFALPLGMGLYFIPFNPPLDGSPSWSPDGTKIAFYSERDGNSEIYVMNADGSNSTRLTRSAASEGYPNFSPDGTKISFDTNRDGNFEIYVMNADGSNPTRLTRDPARDVSASWSPDGRKIAFMSDRAGEFEIWVMNADGSNPVRMTDFGSNWFPRWAPDGARLAYHVGRDIHALDVKESKFTRLTIDPDNGMYPSWSPDGRRIAFMSWRAGPTEIYVMNADGTEQRRLTQTAVGDVIDPRWSPDDQRIALVHAPRGLQATGPRIIYVMKADGSNARRLSRWSLSFETLRFLFTPPFRAARIEEITTMEMTTMIKISIKPIVMLLLIATLALTNAPVQTVWARGQEARTSGNARTTTRNAIAAPGPDDLKIPQSEMQNSIVRYSVDRATTTRSAGNEMSPARQTRLKQFYTEWLASLGRLNFDAMSQDGKIDYLLFKNHIESELRQLDIQARALAEVAPYIPFASAIVDLDEARRRMEPIDSPKSAALLNSLNNQIEATSRGIEAESRTQGRAESDVTSAKMKKTIANRAVTAVNNLRNTLRQWFGFYNGYDPIFTWWMGEPYKQVDQSLQRYATFLRERIVGLRAVDEAGGTLATGPSASGNPGGRGGRGAPVEAGGGGGGGAPSQPGSSDDIIGNPIGREALISDLAREMIPYTPEELIAIGHKEFAWCENEMKKASRELGYGDAWMKALEHVKTLYVEPGKQPQLIRDLALEAIKFMDDHDLLTIPQLARDSWKIEMMSPERQLVNPFFTGGETISVSYPTNTMGHEQKMMSMRGNNIHFARATVHHELIPGHHLQGFMASRYRPYRGLFSTPFWGEGWALYWELLLWDLDFAKSPENRIGMLFWRMHRCARIIFSLSFHLEKMTPQECIDFLVKRVGHEPENATAEVRRSFAGSYGPLYQAAYLLGGLQIYSLHKELVDSGRMTNRAFHDAMLQMHGMPIEMMRASLTNQKLLRDFKSNWKFYGPNPGVR